MKVLEFKNVNLTYFSSLGETPAIKNLSFSVEDGEFISIVGPSGCGKTTILSLISGLIKPTSGTVLINNTEVDTSHTGYMFQKDHLFEWRNILKNVCLGLEIQKRSNANTKEYANNLLKKYGLWDFRNKYPHELSGGMRQRVALIRTLAMNPKILLLDEPFSALDYQTRLNVCDDVHQIIKSEKKTAILVTHDISEAISMSDKIIVLSKRPATVKSVYSLDLKDYGTPLQRRESPDFSKIFDKIWKELQEDEK